MDADEPTPSALLDIATNLLAILLIVTLFALTAPRQHQEGASQSQIQAPPRTAQPFSAPQRELFPPFSRFYLVFADRVVVWDQAAVVAALAADPDTHAARTAQGRLLWLPEPLVTRDIDTFQLHFWPDQDALRTQSAPWSAAQTTALLAQLAQDAARHQIAPVFIVYPDGMETFVPLYAQLQASGLRFRWFTQTTDQPLLIGRHIAQFTHYGLYW